MTTAYTSLLGLALPVTGELSGTWGDTVNNSITSLVDTAVAGTTNVSADSNVTLTTTTGASNQARQAILLFSGSRTAIRTVTAPAQSKIYTVINATTGGFAVQLVGAGPTTGVTIANGARATVAWNGSDFVELSRFSNLTTYADATIYGVTVGRGAGAVSTNTAVGASALAANTTGGFNTAVGTETMTANTEGSLNVAIGRRAVYTNTTGTDNTGVGTSAIRLNTTGSYNVAVGSNALLNNTTASNNTAVGYQAGYANTTASSNTAVGSIALFSNQTGDGLTAVGRGALYSNTGSNNTGIAYLALYSNTSGASNTALGVSALQANTTASNNTAVGYQAAYSNTTAVGLTAVGFQTLYSNQTGSSYNTGLGFQAGYSNTTGSYNVFIGGYDATGYSAGFSNTTGAFNVAIGNGALARNTTASENTAVGYRAGYSNTTGAGNTAVGRMALLSTTTGGQNSAYGLNALYANTTGINNTAIGYAAMEQNTTGNYNTVVGYYAGYTNTTGADNTYIGYQAGQVATGASNTFVGRTSGANITTGTKNTILGRYDGNYGGLDIRTSSNNIVLSDGDGNPKGFFSGTTWIVGSSAGANWDTATSGNGSTITMGLYYSRNSSATSGRYWKTGPDSGNAYLVYNQAETGVYIANGATSWTANSDERLKDIIEPITDAANKVLSMRSVIGKYKTDEEGTRRSFLIAQDVQAVLPEAVSTHRIKGDDTDYLGVSYTDVIPLLVAAIKEQTVLINSLKARLDAANL
jgi:hypothetical protein